MARNEEKAQSMLYRFREAQAAELGIIRKKERRPALASSVNTVGECERWRRQLVGMVSRKVSKIQDSTLTDYQVRDLNDEINKLLREKHQWEKRILQLGGADYSRAPRIIDKEGKEVPGTRGYKYFGRARDLPGVRELFEQEAHEPVGRSRTEIYKDIDADYYGYRDEEDGELLEYEAALEKELEEQATGRDDVDAAEIDGEPKVPVPDQKSIESYLVNLKREQLLNQYAKASE